MFSEQIIEVLNALCEKFGIAIDWTAENVLPYLKELCAKYVSYEIWTSVAWIGVFMIAIIAISICYAISNKTLNAWIAEDPDYRDLDDAFDYPIGWVWAFSLVILIVAVVVGVVGIVWQAHDIITCLTFPEKIIFDYLQGLLQSAK